MPNVNPNLPDDPELEDQLKIFVIGFLAGAVVISAAVGFYWLTNNPSPPVGPSTSMLQEQYYRGAFDICSAVNMKIYNRTHEQAIQICNEATKEMIASGWYDQPSEGFEYAP